MGLHWRHTEMQESYFCPVLRWYHRIQEGKWLGFCLWVHNWKEKRIRRCRSSLGSLIHCHSLSGLLSLTVTLISPQGYLSSICGYLSSISLTSTSRVDSKPLNRNTSRRFQKYPSNITVWQLPSEPTGFKIMISHPPPILWVRNQGRACVWTYFGCLIWSL